MSTTTPKLSRRAVLGAGTALGALPILASCGGSDPSEQAAGSVVVDDAAILPAYTQTQPVPPDIPGTDGSTPGYTTYPSDLPQTVDAPPGSGGTFTCMVPTAWRLRPDCLST